jgi:GNAT superfamily N-acetyltransferase
MTLILRTAEPDDADLIAGFNTAMAWETEQRRLRPERIGAGVRHLIAHPALGFYLLAERDGAVLGSLLVTTEWSDWRNGVFWWVQSVYVVPAARRQGIYAALYAQVKRLAAASSGVCGFRLYVERDNAPAQLVYRRLGMQETHYRLYEETPAGPSPFLEPPA